jgi:vacuolar-type H+-ATPase subunit I/STV1
MMIDKHKIIFEKLKSKVNIAVEYKGFQLGLQSEEVFNYFRNENTPFELVKLEAFKNKINKISESYPDEYKSLLESLNNIDQELSNYSKKLAVNALVGEVDVSKVEDSHFDKLAVIFEDINKSKLVVLSPSAWP